MIDQTIKDLEAQIQSTKNLDTTQKKELQALLASLKREIVDLAKTHREDADSIASFTRVTTGEVLKDHPNPKLMGIALSGIRASVEKFEVSHPELTLTVNGISTYLANIGI
jgi:hypothetical protein